MFLISSLSFAQEGLGYYHDIMNNFYVFDRGVERQLEYNHINDVKVGCDYLAYVDSRKSFIYYHNGEKQTIEDYPPTKISVTPYALVYKMLERLMICENGDKKLLYRNVLDYSAGDSLIVWQTYPGLDIMAYENGQTKTIIPATTTAVVNDYKVVSNIMAFNDLNNNLKIYFHGNIYESGSSRVDSYDCAHNIVAFVDTYKSTFNVFYNGEFQVLSKELIQSYSVSNDMVTYIDVNNNFYVFYQGGITKIDSKKPDYYYNKGNIFYYSYNFNLKIVFDGTIYTQKLVDSTSIITGNNSMLFYSNVNQPKFFYKGKVYDNFYVQKPYTMELFQDLPVFRYFSTIGFLYNGKIHEYGSHAN